jgi:biopolymer transport protein ExbD
MAGHKKKRHFQEMDGELDLVPLIDVVFLILLFFILCGRLTVDQRTQQITVPPTRTAMKFEAKGWERVVLNVYGSTQNGSPPRNTIAMPPTLPWVTEGPDNYTGYQKMRARLNQVHDKAEKYDDPKGTGIKLPKVIVEIRADAETEYRVVQEVQQILSDTIDPSNNMLPRQVSDPKQLKSFVNIDFTTRKPTDK